MSGRERDGTIVATAVSLAPRPGLAALALVGWSRLRRPRAQRLEGRAGGYRWCPGAPYEEVATADKYGAVYSPCRCQAFVG